MVSNFSIPNAYNGSAAHRSALRDFSANLVGRYVGGTSIDSTRTAPRVLMGEDLRLEVKMLKELTWTYVIEVSGLSAQQHGQQRIINDLYDIYSIALNDTKKLSVFPMFYRERLDANKRNEVERLRIPVDLIAGMTESQAIAMHRRLTGQSHSSGLEEIFS
jgi:dGTPase